MPGSGACVFRPVLPTRVVEHHVLTDSATSRSSLRAAQPRAATPPAAPGPGSHPRPRKALTFGLGALAVAVVAGLAALVLSRYQNPNAHYDEFFHILAAEHLIESGSPVLVPDGDPYNRGRLYTRMVVTSFRWFGPGIDSARLPALLAGALTIGAVALLGYRAGGWLVGASAAGLLLLTPGFINAAQTARFYAPHVLAVVVLALLVFEAGRPGVRWWGRVAWASLAAGCAYFALHLHETTLVVAMGLGCWIALLVAFAAVHAPSRRVRIAAGVAVAAGLVLLPIAAAVVSGTDWGQGKWQTFRWSPGWSSSDSNDARYYHKLMLSMYASMWVLFPLASVAALVTRWRPAALFLSVFGVGIVVQSLGGAKAERYILYLYPFFWLTWGLALDAMLRGLYARMDGRAAQVTPRRWVVRSARAMNVALLAGCLLVFFHFLPSTAIARRMLTTPDRHHPYQGTSWTPAVPLLLELAEQSETVVATADLKALYYLNRLDVTLNRLGAIEGGMDEFAISDNTLRPVISTGESIAKVIDESPTGLIIIEPGYWRQTWGVPDETADVIETRAVPVDPPARSNLMIFRWPGHAAESGVELPVAGE